MEKYLSILKALADETRLRIINLLYERELCVCEIEEIVGASQAKISRHLAYLKNSGLVHIRRSAQWSFYSIEKSTGLKFVDELVHGVLRNKDIYLDDLNTLKKKVKTETCDMSTT
ncbi:MAG TPA: metalloregulator ArsR/SmtB family transcription factor [Candidatus Deferrimicrobium sp.]|nr:metalloregulator ArsR/SmtB family transcription factor [Candidatus Deferrimicrobium sp.]